MGRRDLEPCVYPGSRQDVPVEQGGRGYNVRMKQHHVPRVYLQQWRDADGLLVRYCRIGPPGAPKLRCEKRSPKEICWRRDLYSLPEGGIANGKTGNELEALLSTEVEQAIPGLVAAVSGRSGLLEPALGDHIRWLMQTFVARDPDMLVELESEMADWATEHESMIRRILANALTSEIAAELKQYLDPRMPTVAARAGLAGIVAAGQRPMRGWLEGQVTVLRSSDIRPVLDALGLDHFPTFEDPVVQWEANAAGLIASFSVSPDVLVLVLEDARETGWDMVLRHLVSALSHRQFAICRTRAAQGLWLGEAENLLPWTPPG